MQNCPRQIGSGSSDRPRDGDSYTHSVLPGDVIMLASDGVLDNLYDDEIAELLNQGGSAAILSDRLATRARCLSLDGQRRSPFTLEAAKAGYKMPGGKLDDVTLVLIKVLDGNDADGDATTATRDEPSVRSKL